MKNEQPLRIAIIQEILIFFAFVGVSAISWAVANDGSDFWKGVSKSMLWAYPVRFAAEAITRYRGKPLLRLMPEDRAT
jgi:hypothetical protein